jgi:hypothetical protein
MMQMNWRNVLAQIDMLAGLFQSEHRNPVNRAIHFWIGMPLVGLGLALIVLLNWQGVVSVLLGYAAMFVGHYAFEKKPPTVIKTPLGPLAAGAFVIRQLFIRPFQRESKN